MCVCVHTPQLLRTEEAKSQGELEHRMDGWTVKQEVFDNSYERLHKLALRVVRHYQEVLMHITVLTACGGDTHSALINACGMCGR